MGLSSRGSSSLLQLGPHTAPEESADSIVLLIPEIPQEVLALDRCCNDLFVKETKAL